VKKGNLGVSPWRRYSGRDRQGGLLAEREDAEVDGVDWQLAGYG
jgi:hypothetical protein